MTINNLKYKEGETTYDVASKIKEEVDEILLSDFEAVNGELSEDIDVQIEIRSKK